MSLRFHQFRYIVAAVAVSAVLGAVPSTSAQEKKEERYCQTYKKLNNQCLSKYGMLSGIQDFQKICVKANNLVDESEVLLQRAEAEEQRDIQKTKDKVKGSVNAHTGAQCSQAKVYAEAATGTRELLAKINEMTNVLNRQAKNLGEIKKLKEEGDRHAQANSWVLERGGRTVRKGINMKECFDPEFQKLYKDHELVLKERLGPQIAKLQQKSQRLGARASEIDSNLVKIDKILGGKTTGSCGADVASSIKDASQRRANDAETQRHLSRAETMGSPAARRDQEGSVSGTSKPSSGSKIVDDVTNELSRPPSRENDGSVVQRAADHGARDASAVSLQCRVATYGCTTTNTAAETIRRAEANQVSLDRDLKERGADGVAAEARRIADVSNQERAALGKYDLSSEDGRREFAARKAQADARISGACVSSPAACETLNRNGQSPHISDADVRKGTRAEYRANGEGEFQTSYEQTESYADKIKPVDASKINPKTVEGALKDATKTSARVVEDSRKTIDGVRRDQAKIERAQATLSSGQMLDPEQSFALGGMNDDTMNKGRAIQAVVESPVSAGAVAARMDQEGIGGPGGVTGREWIDKAETLRNHQDTIETVGGVALGVATGGTSAAVATGGRMAARQAVGALTKDFAVSGMPSSVGDINQLRLQNTQYENLMATAGPTSGLAAEVGPVTGGQIATAGVLALDPSKTLHAVGSAGKASMSAVGRVTGATPTHVPTLDVPIIGSGARVADNVGVTPPPRISADTPTVGGHADSLAVPPRAEPAPSGVRVADNTPSTQLAQNSPAHVSSTPSAQAAPHVGSPDSSVVRPLSGSVDSPTGAARVGESAPSSETHLGTGAGEVAAVGRPADVSIPAVPVSTVPTNSNPAEAFQVSSVNRAPASTQAAQIPPPASVNGTLGPTFRERVKELRSDAVAAKREFSEAKKTSDAIKQLGKAVEGATTAPQKVGLSSASASGRAELKSLRATQATQTEVVNERIARAAASEARVEKAAGVARAADTEVSAARAARLDGASVAAAEQRAAAAGRELASAKAELARNSARAEKSIERNVALSRRIDSMEPAPSPVAQTGKPYNWESQLERPSTTVREALENPERRMILRGEEAAAFQNRVNKGIELDAQSAAQTRRVDAALDRAVAAEKNLEKAKVGGNPGGVARAQKALDDSAAAFEKERAANRKISREIESLDSSGASRAPSSVTKGETPSYKTHTDGPARTANEAMQDPERRMILSRAEADKLRALGDSMSIADDAVSFRKGEFDRISKAADRSGVDLDAVAKRVAPDADDMRVQADVVNALRKDLPEADTAKALKKAGLTDDEARRLSSEHRKVKLEQEVRDLQKAPKSERVSRAKAESDAIEQQAVREGRDPMEVRTQRAEEVLGRELSDLEKAAVRESHEIGLGRDIGSYSAREIAAKDRVLAKAGFDKAERELLVRKGITGDATASGTQTALRQTDYQAAEAARAAIRKEMAEAVQRGEKSAIQEVRDRGQRINSQFAEAEKIEVGLRKAESTPTRSGITARKVETEMFSGRHAGRPEFLDTYLKNGVFKPVGGTGEAVVFRGGNPRNIRPGDWVTAEIDNAERYAQGFHNSGAKGEILTSRIPKEHLYEVHPGGWVYIPPGTPPETVGKILRYKDEAGKDVTLRDILRNNSSGKAVVPGEGAASLPTGGASSSLGRSAQIRDLKELSPAQRVTQARAESTAIERKAMMEGKNPVTVRQDRAAEVLGRNLTSMERDAVRDAHKVGGAKKIGDYTPKEIARKNQILREAGFPRDDRELLIRRGITGGGDDLDFTRMAHGAPSPHAASLSNANRRYGAAVQSNEAVRKQMEFVDSKRPIKATSPEEYAAEVRARAQLAEAYAHDTSAYLHGVTNQKQLTDRTAKYIKELEGSEDAARAGKSATDAKARAGADAQVGSTKHQADIHTMASESEHAAAAVKAGRGDRGALTRGMADSDKGKLIKYQELLTAESGAAKAKSDLLLDFLAGRGPQDEANILRKILDQAGAPQESWLLNPKLSNDQIRDVFKNGPMLKNYLHEYPGMADAVMAYRSGIINAKDFEKQIRANLFHNGPDEGFWGFFGQKLVPDFALAGKGPQAESFFENTILAGTRNEKGVVVPRYGTPTSYEAGAHLIPDRVSQGTRGGVEKIFKELEAGAPAGKFNPVDTMRQMVQDNPAGTAKQLKKFAEDIEKIPGLTPKQASVLRAMNDAAEKRVTKLSEYLKENMQFVRNEKNVAESMEMRMPDGTTRIFKATDNPDDVLSATMDIMKHEEKLHGDPIKDLLKPASGGFSEYAAKETQIRKTTSIERADLNFASSVKLSKDSISVSPTSQRMAELRSQGLSEKEIVAKMASERRALMSVASNARPEDAVYNAQKFKMMVQDSPDYRLLGEGDNGMVYLHRPNGAEEGQYVLKVYKDAINNPEKAIANDIAAFKLLDEAFKNNGVPIDTVKIIGQDKTKLRLEYNKGETLESMLKGNSISQDQRQALLKSYNAALASMDKVHATESKLGRVLKFDKDKKINGFSQRSIVLKTPDGPVTIILKPDNFLVDPVTQRITLIDPY